MEELKKKEQELKQINQLLNGWISYRRQVGWKVEIEYPSEMIILTATSPSGEAFTPRTVSNTNKGLKILIKFLEDPRLSESEKPSKPNTNLWVGLKKLFKSLLGI